MRLAVYGVGSITVVEKDTQMVSQAVRKVQLAS